MISPYKAKKGLLQTLTIKPKCSNHFFFLTAVSCSPDIYYRFVSSSAVYYSLVCLLLSCLFITLLPDFQLLPASALPDSPFHDRQG